MFKALVRYSALLKIDAARRPRWQQILDELAPFPTTVAGRFAPFRNATVFDECKDSGDFGGNARYPVVYFGAIHPAAAITRHSTPELMQTARETVEQINTLNHWIPENGLCMGWPAAGVVSDNASATSAHMDQVCRTDLSSNFVPQIHGGCVSEQAGATQGINDLLFQSYDNILSLYPAGGIGDRGDSSFRTLRARGAFLVSAAWDGARGGVADGVEILSEAGNECVLERPWSGGLTLRRAADNSSVPVAPSKLCARCVSFATEVGASYLVSRAPPARRLKTTDSALAGKPPVPCDPKVSTKLCPGGSECPNCGKASCLCPQPWKQCQPHCPGCHRVPPPTQRPYSSLGLN